MRNCFLLLGISFLTATCDSSDKKGESQATTIQVSYTLHKAASVYLTKDEKEQPVMSWCETDSLGKKFFYLSFFDPTTEKFSPAISIPIEQNASIHEEGMPKVAIKGNGSIVAVYETSSPTKENEYAGAVHYIQSFDKGKNWTQPLSIHSDTSTNGSHSFASIARLGNGEVGVCWLDATLDRKKGGRPVKFASTSDSSGFQNEVLIEPRACECCRTAISCNKKGNISVVFRSIGDGSIRDISLSTSSDNGKSFNRPVSFSNDNWVINGCPHNGPSVMNTDKATYATWFTGGKSKGVYYCELSKENKATFKRQVSADGRNIQLCLLPNGARVIAYSEQIHQKDSVFSRIVANRMEEGKVFVLNVTPEKAHATYPVLAAYGKDKIIIAWSENDKVFYKLILANEIGEEMKQPSTSLEYKIASIGGIKLSNKTDPSCGMQVDKDVQDTAFVNNKVIGFCSKVCKEKFLTASNVYKKQ